MSWAGVYFFLALLSVTCTVCAMVQARKLYWLSPLYFFTAWLCGELALIHLIWQLALTALLAFTGGLSDPLAQSGLGLFTLSWLGLVYLHCQSMDTPHHLGAALRRALGDECLVLSAAEEARGHGHGDDETAEQEQREEDQAGAAEGSLTPAELE